MPNSLGAPNVLGVSCTTAHPEAILNHLLGVMLEPPPVPDFKRCGCGRLYTAEAWQALPYVGVQRLDDEPDLELRNCACGSTLAIPVTR